MYVYIYIYIYMYDIWYMIYIYIYIYIWYDIHIYIYICDMWYTTVGNDHPCVFLVFRCEKHVVDLFNMYLTCLNSKQGCQQQEMRIEVAEEMGIWPARHGSNQHSGVYIYIRIYIYIYTYYDHVEPQNDDMHKHAKTILVWYFVVGL